MPAVLTFLGFVGLAFAGVLTYALVTNPNRRIGKLDANHHQMYSLLVELKVQDAITPLFDTKTQVRVTQLVSDYQKEITS